MHAINPAALAIRGRWAVGAVFFMNGFLTGSWAPQIPGALDPARHHAVHARPADPAVRRRRGRGDDAGAAISSRCYGARTVVRWFGACGTFGLLLVALAPNVPLAAIAMFLFGGAIGGMDVAMNANAVVVEKKLSRAIMSSLHGFWSLGGFVGGGLGGIAIQNFGHLSPCRRRHRGGDRDRALCAARALSGRKAASRAQAEDRPAQDARRLSRRADGAVFA